MRTEGPAGFTCLARQRANCVLAQHSRLAAVRDLKSLLLLVLGFKAATADLLSARTTAGIDLDWLCC